MPSSAIPSRPPGPRGHLLVGSLPELRGNPLPFLTDVARRYGDVAYCQIANVPVYVVSHPDLIEGILVTDNRKFIKPRLLRDAGEVLGNGLLTSDGDLWLRQRRLMQPAFHRDKIATYGGVMVERTLRMLDGWSDGDRFDLHAEMMRLTMGIVAETLFGADVEDRFAEVEHALDLSLKRFVERMSLIRLLDALPLPRNVRFRKATGVLDEIIYGVIEQRRREEMGREEMGREEMERNAKGRDEEMRDEEHRDHERRDDLLTMLLRAQDEDGSRMTDKQLRDEVVTLFLAGHETTAIALSWTWYLLSENPDVERRLVEEVTAVLGDRPPTLDDIPHLVYADMVIRESMRLYPPAWRIGREVIEEVDIGGYAVPVGAQVIMSQWVVHRDERFYPDPERFRPERWSDPGVDELPRFAYFPFGGGARRCIGDTFAMMEAILVMTTIVQRYHLSLQPGQRIEAFPSITLRPKYGLDVVAERRRE